MTVAAPWTAIRDSPNKSLRQNVKRVGVVLHHAAMTSLSGLRTMEVQGTKQVSSTAICKDDELELIVWDDRYRPWSLANAYGDSAYRSIEICNESTNGWTVSARSQEKAAQAVAFWAEKDGFRPHRSGPSKTWTVRGHREMEELGLSYATACPGALDLDWITARATALLDGISTASLETAPISAPLPEENPDMVIIRTKQHGYYMVAPGVVISLPDDKLIRLIQDGWLPKAPPIYDSAPDDLAMFLFQFGGCPKDQIPAVGQAWRLAS